jgi:TRAP transporter TAXI family solute receptor
MIKNRLRWLMFLLLPLLFVVSACGNTAQGGQPAKIINDNDVPLALSVLRLNMSAGESSGNYYKFGAVLASTVDEASGYLIIALQPSGDSRESIERLMAGEAQLALAPSDTLSYAFHGTDIWVDTPPATAVAPLMTLYPEICQLVTGVSSGLTTVEDLKGRRVAIGEEGSALQAGAWKILNEHGLNEGDIEALSLGFDAAAQAMREKTIDAFFVTAATPNKGMMDLQAEREITIIGLEDEKIAALIEKYPFYTRYTLDENDYSFLTAPVNTVALRATLVAAASLSEQIAYDIVKAIIENSDKIAMVHAKGMYINAGEAALGLPLELHAGALRYFKEIAALTEPAPPDEAEQEEMQE